MPHTRLGHDNLSGDEIENAMQSTDWCRVYNVHTRKEKSLAVNSGFQNHFLTHYSATGWNDPISLYLKERMF